MSASDALVAELRRQNDWLLDSVEAQTRATDSLVDPVTLSVAVVRAAGGSDALDFILNCEGLS